MVAILKEQLERIHPEWRDLVQEAMQQMDESYWLWLKNNDDYLPTWENLLAAFRVPFTKTRYLLLGESPYPRPQSANGFAFWDNSVKSLWSPTGFSKEVNRATSLRNFFKMLLLARGDLSEARLTQEAIAVLDKSRYKETGEDFFSGMLDQGFLLLNATLVYSPNRVNYHAKIWQPFLEQILLSLAEKKPDLILLLFGRIAAAVPNADRFHCVKAEHPYNLSFITNAEIIDFFKPLDLLCQTN